MRRRALLASAAAASTASLAGCPTPPWSDAAIQFDGAEVTFRREHTDEFDPADSDRLGGVELRPDLDREPPRLLIRGIAMGGVQECYRVSLADAERSAERLSIEVAVKQRPFISACNDAGEGHPYEIGVAFTEVSVPDRVVVRHGDETVLDTEV